MDDDEDALLAQALLLSLEGDGSHEEQTETGAVESATAPSQEVRWGGCPFLPAFPVLRQINRDILEADNKLVRVFVDFSEWKEHHRILYHVVLTGESAWSADTKRVCETATKFYRANNSMVWKRTADLNTFFLQYAADGSVVGVGFPYGNFSADQSLFSAAKPLLSVPMVISNIVLCEDGLAPDEERDDAIASSRVIRWRSVMMYSGEPVPSSSVQCASLESASSAPSDSAWSNSLESAPSLPPKSSTSSPTGHGRPIIYLNTCNHLMHVRPSPAYKDHDDTFWFTYHDEDIFWPGTYDDAEEYAQALPDRSDSMSRMLLRTLGIKF
tara:strand:+ start:303 stop:1283 length:981 start_codon:yes stop_codon:yes gene_type:complete